MNDVYPIILNIAHKLCFMSKFEDYVKVQKSHARPRPTEILELLSSQVITNFIWQLKTAVSKTGIVGHIPDPELVDT